MMVQAPHRQFRPRLASPQLVADQRALHCMWETLPEDSNSRPRAFRILWPARLEKTITNTFFSVKQAADAVHGRRAGGQEEGQHSSTTVVI